MTVISMTGAASGGEVDWHQIDWASAHRTARRLQMRIAKAVREGRWGKVKALQWLLTHSRSGKAIAVKRVTENQGKKTLGVDGEIWDTPGKRARGMLSLARRGYQPQPLRRVFIPKANGKMRPLGIPTMRDRAMQALHLLALEPISESTADPNSYGFRPERASRDAAEQCFQALRQRVSAQWVLDADISGCFDNIGHDWLIANVPTDKVVLRKWLESGFVQDGELFATEAGTPQGGIISPTLANMTLDGMERVLRKRFAPSHPQCRKNKVNLIRYADDFVITGASKELLEEARSLMEDFLQQRGLALSEEKTKIVHIEEGFDFLGWNVRKYDGKLLIKPAKKNVQAFLRKVRTIIREARTAKQEYVIGRLNPVIRGWANYHRNQVAAETFGKVDHLIWKQLWQWACRRHPHKPLTWVKDRYFAREGTRNWVFRAEVNDDEGNYDTRNAPARQMLRAIADRPGSTFRMTNRMFNGSGHIGHNKFVVYMPDGKTGTQVLTGSTNWTWTGIAGQSNNCTVIEDADIAAGYVDYWDRLLKDKQVDPVPLSGPATGAVQGDTLKTGDLEPRTAALGGGATIEAWYSPNMPGKAQPSTSKSKAPEAPPDMVRLFSLMRQAKRAIFFLVFYPSQGGANSIVGEAVNIGLKDTTLEVVGAVSDPKAMWLYQPGGKTPTGQKIPGWSPRVFEQAGVSIVRATALTDKTLADDIGDFKLGEMLTAFGNGIGAIIHDKILVIDPMDPKNCVVAFGSHNQGFKASYGNDENLVIVQGHRAIAQAYAAHVLDVYDHYKFRAREAEIAAKKKGQKSTAGADETGWDGFLKTTDSWQKKASKRIAGYVTE
ncbi:group II intron reverse transcriptase/maturase [Mesorhizobium sp. M0019]